MSVWLPVNDKVLENRTNFVFAHRRWVPQSLLPAQGQIVVLCIDAVLISLPFVGGHSWFPDVWGRGSPSQFLNIHAITIAL